MIAVNICGGRRGRGVQHYVIKFVIWNIVESGVKHHQTNKQTQYTSVHFVLLFALLLTGCYGYHCWQPLLLHFSQFLIHQQDTTSVVYGTAEVTFAVDPCGGSTGSHMTGRDRSDVSHVTGSNVAVRNPDRKWSRAHAQPEVVQYPP